MNRKNQSSKTALLTGASSGIGQATAELLAKAGYTVYGTSRRGGVASGRSFEMLPLDVTSDASVADAVTQLMQREGRIDLLVNNAGFGVAPAGSEESTIEQAQSIFDTNFFRYTAGGLASRLTLLRRFAPAGLVDAGIRKDLRLDGTLAVKSS